MNNDKLESLHTAIVDARKGYVKAIEEADQADLRALFEEIDSAHASAHSDIHRALTSQGEEADDSGSIMGTVHKTVIAVRSAITGIDHGSLDAFIDGERRTVEYYDDAIAEQSAGRVGAMLQHHRDRLQGLIARMEASKTSA